MYYTLVVNNSKSLCGLTWLRRLLWEQDIDCSNQSRETKHFPPASAAVLYGNNVRQPDLVSLPVYPGQGDSL